MFIVFPGGKMESKEKKEGEKRETEKGRKEAKKE